MKVPLLSEHDSKGVIAKRLSQTSFLIIFSLNLNYLNVSFLPFVMPNSSLILFS